MLRRLALSGLLGALATSAPALAQSNEIPGTDVSLGLLQEIVSQGRTGTFPNGLNAVSMSTTSCNLGTVNVPWLEPMEEDHPLIAFLVAREDDSGRLYQISDRSYVKHGFFALSNSQCIPCQNPSFFGNFLGVGCSDTYDTNNNALNFYLGPADEIDPWLGTWEAECSFFDAGLDPQPGTMCDGQRSFSFSQSESLGPIGFRVQLTDEDLSSDGDPSFYYSSQYVVRGEPEANRENNIASRGFLPTFTGSQWNFNVGLPLLEGTILQRWSGATVTSEKNGLDDGRVYVAVKVTGPVDGLWHYEYAFHNRDNNRGVDEIRLPICPSAGIQDFGFHDPDEFGANDWTASVEGSEVVATGTGNALRWNTIYNVWFDSPAAPVAGNVTLVQADAGPGAASFDVPTTVPGSAAFVSTGPGCANGAPGTFIPNGLPIPGDTGFAFLGEGLSASSPVLLYGSPLAGSLPIAPCTLWLGGLIGPQIKLYGSGSSDASGDATLALPLPNNPALDGLTFEFQAVVLPAGGGPLLGVAELSDGWRIQFGTPTGCL